MLPAGVGDRLSREEFLSQGNAICSQGNARIELDALGDLNPPEDLEADVDSLLQVAQSSLNEVKDGGPQVLLTEQDPFAEANRLAGEVGLTACAE